MSLLTTLFLIGLLVVFTVVLIIYEIKRYYPVSVEQAIKVSPGKRPRLIRVGLDATQEQAVAELTRDGWKRQAAVSALVSIGWRGYPDVPEMVQAAWKSMPGYRR